MHTIVGSWNGSPKLIAEKQLRIERFVRCASPSRGTLLAGENIDIFLSVLTNLVGLIPAVGGTPLYEVTKRIALEIIRSRRTMPSLVPGLEAMMPQSPLVALLNNLEAPALGAMGVIAGDIEGGNWLKRLGVFANDHIIYEARDNDLVVNTDAMFHGARRDLAAYVFDQGGDVSHFNYFRNPRTRASLVDWLAAPTGERPPTFHELEADEFEPVPMLRSMQTRAGADQPIVFVLPGIMGSHLNIGDREVWLHYVALLRGGLGDLADVDATNVRAGRPRRRRLPRVVRVPAELSRGDPVRVRLAPIGDRRGAAAGRRGRQRVAADTATGAHRRSQHGRAGGARDDRGATRPVGPHVRA